MPIWGSAETTIGRQGAFWLVLRGLVCSRPSLLAQLGQAAVDKTCSDAELVLALYRRLGSDCVRHLAGDWSFALWDPERQELILAKDPTGNCAMYWWSDAAGRTLFANHMATLIASGPVPRRPDPRWISGLITVFYDPEHPSATAFEHVHALPPGYLVRFRNGQMNLVEWWRPEAASSMDLGSPEALTEEVLALFRDAVVQRLSRQTGTVAATLSGGLDSGSVVAMAAPVLKAQGQRLQAYVHVPRFNQEAGTPGRTGNEWSLAEDTARRVGNVDLHACPSHSPDPLDAIDTWLDVMAVPSHAPGHWFWYLDIVRQSVANGSSTMLTGEGGNATISFAGYGSLWGRIKSLEFGKVARELVQETGGLPSAISNRLLKPALRPLWRSLFRRFDEGWRLKGRPAWTDFGLLDKSLAGRIQLQAAMHAVGHDPGLRSVPSHHFNRWRAGLLGLGSNTFAIGHSLGMSHGIEWRDPTRDRRLVEQCLRLPDEVFWCHGVQRGLIRRGMRESLPPHVLACTAKGLQSSDLRERLIDSGPKLMAAVESVVRHPVVADWFDTQRMRVSAQEIVAGVDGTSPAGVTPHHLLRALAAANFVARHA